THAYLVSLGDCLVFGKEVVNDNFGESRVVHLLLLFVTSVVDLTFVDDSGKSSPTLMHLINNNIGIFILVDRIPELVHVNFRNICSGEKCRIAWSESKSIQDNLKCRFSLFISRIDSFIAFSNLKPFLFGNKFKIKFGLLSSDGRHNSTKISHIQTIISLKNNLDHEK
ncbi:hypothetical protein Tco_1566274, partial [Tanacetum coccineum]